MIQPPSDTGDSPKMASWTGEDCLGAETNNPSTSSTPSPTIPTHSSSLPTTSSPTSASSSTTTPPIPSSSGSTNSSNAISYAAATRSNSLPTAANEEAAPGDLAADRQAAVVADAVEGLDLEDYLLALTTVVQPRDITFAGRISLGRVCVYLRTRELAEEVVSSPPIPQKGKLIKFRKLVLESIPW